MEERKLLEGLMKKQTKGERLADNKNAVAALMSLRKSCDEKQLAEYLVGLHFSVCRNFLMEYCVEASDEEINNLTNALVDNESMKIKNPNLFLYSKGFAAIHSLTANQKYAPALVVMNRILAKAYGKKGYTLSIRKIFDKFFITDSNGVIELYNQVENGKIKLENAEKERFTKFLEYVDVMCRTKAKAKEIISNLPNEDASVRFAEQINEIEFKILSNIEKTQVDIVAMLKKLTADSESRAAKELENIELRKKVDDLSERLRVSLQMNDVSKNQELVTLKSEISKAVKLDFADYDKSKNKGHSKDLFKVYRSMLARIFKQLGRLGIPLS